MKIEQFSEALGNVNDKYINEAIDSKMDLAEMAAGQGSAGRKASNQAARDPKRMRRSMKVWRAIAIAACAILVVSGGLLAAAAGLGGAFNKGAADYRDTSMTPAGAGEYNGAYVSDEESYYDDYAKDAAFAPEESEWKNESTSGADGSYPQQNNLKIIYTAYLYMETTEFDTSMQQIEDLASRTGAYFEDASVNSSSYNYRTASYVVRVPEENLDAFLDQCEGIATITSFHKNAQDVSESYYDIETRLETAKAKMARLQELLAAATHVEDMITIEREISDTQYQIDSLTGSLQHYDSRISYSTVSIELREVYKISEEVAPLSFGQRIAKAFKNSLSGFGNFLEGLVIFLARNWIWMLIVAVIVVVVVTIIVKAKKRNRK
ncbi:MAG: DUF4349 domain-containing protein [Lachnospiraceae bacterium]|nr:DUF4349 domain-containing protein [Lachnospiraceae bacterium]